MKRRQGKRPAVSEPQEYDGVPISRLLPAWRAQVAKLSLEANELQSENARLKAEVEELTGLLKASTYYNSSDEVTRLKAEVERLTAFTTRTIIPNEELQAQVERLTKAGDYLSEHLEYEFGDNPSSKLWNAAKQGGQP
jgi:predicted RNase H-like nuclease (RuvC/YqgF family)